MHATTSYGPRPARGALPLLLTASILAAACGGDGATEPEPPVNQAPNLTSHGGPYSGDEGASLSLAAAAADPEGSALTFAWDFGDGGTATGASVTHAFADDGEYTVTVTATDSQGAKASATTVARIANLAPVLEELALDPVAEGDSLEVLLRLEDAGEDEWTAEVDWGDGSALEEVALDSAAVRLVHLYTEAGTYPVKVRVSDDDGGEASLAAEVEVVRPAGPTGTIAYSGHGNLYRIHPSGDGARRLTVNGSGSSGSWSPDGDRIAFERGYQIHVMAPDGKETGLTRLTSEGVNQFPAWSPEGSRIAFVGTSGYEGGPGVFVMRADGSDLRRLTSDPNAASGLTWSPDGTRIAYAAMVTPGSDYDLYVVNADGTGARTLLDTEGISTAPAWSPDGERIALTQDGTLTLLELADSSLHAVLPKERGDLMGAWSPDGRWLLFVGDRGGWRDLYLVRPDGTGLNRITTDSFWETYPDWTAATLTDSDGDGVTDDLDRCPQDATCQ